MIERQFASRVIITANVQLHALINDVGTISNGDDLTQDSAFMTCDIGLGHLTRAIHGLVTLIPKTGCQPFTHMHELEFSIENKW